MARESQMRAIPGVLRKDIRAILLECGPFRERERARLEALFTDNRLRQWRYTLPGGASQLERVEALMVAFYFKPYEERNPLLLFMRVLSERTVQPGCRQAAQNQPVPIRPAASPPTTPPPNPVVGAKATATKGAKSNQRNPTNPANHRPPVIPDTRRVSATSNGAAAVKPAARAERHANPKPRRKGGATVMERVRVHSTRCYPTTSLPPANTAIGRQACG